ncbi:gamma-glutamyl-gamma-aminobutyrate hydrolase family protein, partial [Escherichia coli]|nr:gamma-glutamyl-gamma-aminobutyrate hydrolase family protein [Escherichia coli]
MKKPVIGITGNEKAHPDDDIMMSYAAKGFIEGVKDAGGIPIILPIGDQEMAT